MLKLEDFKIKEIETLGTITGGEAPPQQCLDMTYDTVNFLGFIIRTGERGDIHDD